MDRINENMACEKGLIINEDKTKYYEIVKKYKYLFEYYLSSIINFSKYDKLIEASNLYIGKNKKYKALNAYINSDYLFLINNFFVEKLSVDDLKLISNFDQDVISNELMELIKRTYKDIIKDNYYEGEYTDKTYQVCYGPIIPENFVDNDSLVFKIYYGRNLKDFAKDDFIKIHKEQLNFFKQLINEIKRDIMDNFSVKCEILIEKDIYE